MHQVISGWRFLRLWVCRISPEQLQIQSKNQELGLEEEGVDARWPRSVLEHHEDVWRAKLEKRSLRAPQVVSRAIPVYFNWLTIHIPAFTTPYSKYSVLLDPVVETFNSLKFTSIIYVEKVMDHILNLFLIRKLEMG